MPRVIKVRSDAEAGLIIAEDSARLSGGRESFIYTDADGVSIVGNISILAEPENIRVASSYTFPTAYEMALPSTAVTPMPMLKSNSPVEGFSELASTVAELLGELL